MTFQQFFQHPSILTLPHFVHYITTTTINSRSRAKNPAPQMHWDDTALFFQLRQNDHLSCCLLKRHHHNRQGDDLGEDH